MTAVTAPPARHRLAAGARVAGGARSAWTPGVGPTVAREGVSLNVIQRQLGHANLGTTSIYLQGIDTEEIIATVHARRVLDVADALGDELH
jgi:integrase